MPCHAAMIDKFLSASPGDSVEQTLKAMKKAGVDFVPVVDEKGVALGIFSIDTVFENLLPVSVALSSGLQLDIQLGAAPGIAKRLKRVLPATVGDLMNRRFIAVYPETPLWEGVNQLSQTRGPILVLEPKSGKVLGVITGQSALDELNRMKEGEQ